MGREELDIIDVLHYLAFSKEKAVMKGTDENEHCDRNFSSFNITDSDFINNDIFKR